MIRPQKGKWGRHCCRPHSHRRVVALSRGLFGEPPFPRSRARLAPDVSPSPKCRVSSPALAPASDYCLRTFAAFPSRSPCPLRMPLGQCRDRFSFRRSPQTVCLSFRPDFPQAMARSTAIRWMSFAISSNDPTCLRPKPSACLLSKSAWTTSTASKVLEILTKSECCHSILLSFLALSMFRDCAQELSRASLATPTFPLLPRSSVDDGG